MNTRIITIELTRIGEPEHTAEYVQNRLIHEFSEFDDVHVKVQDFPMEDDIYQQAIDTWGVRHQVNHTIQELMELGFALTKALEHSPSNVLEEMADVEIMLEQLKRIFGDTKDMKEHKLFKLQSAIYDEKHPPMRENPWESNV